MENFHNDYNMGYKHGMDEGKNFSLYMLSNIIEDLKSKETTPLYNAINTMFDKLYQDFADELLHHK